MFGAKIRILPPETALESPGPQWPSQGQSPGLSASVEWPTISHTHPTSPQSHSGACVDVDCDLSGLDDCDLCLFWGPDENLCLNSEDTDDVAG